MGVSSTARLPSLGAQSIPPLFSHLQHTSNAKVVARWSITIRSFRAVPVPANAWPSSDQSDSFFAPQSKDLGDAGATNSSSAAPSSTSAYQAGSGGVASASGGGSALPSASGAPPLTKPRTMWQVWLSDHPGVVFVIVEDTGRSSRAKVWRDWEVSTKKWKREKRREIEARKKRQEEGQAEAERAQQAADDAKEQETQTKLGSTAVTEDGNKGPDSRPTTQADTGSTTVDAAEPMDVDAVNAGTLPAAIDADAIPPLYEAQASQQQTRAGASTSMSSTSHTDKPGNTEEEMIATAGPKPKLRLPSHTRYTVSALTSSMSAMLTGLNLPPPHGAPVGTAGPGAWVPRGAAVSIEGLVLEINSQSLNVLPGISPALASVSSLDDTTMSLNSNSASSAGMGGSGAVDWRVRVGSVMGGGGRSAGAIVEAEFLPVSTLLPTSKFMHDFLHSLFPPGLVPLPAPGPAIGLSNGNQLSGTGGTSRPMSGAGTPITHNATVGSAAGVKGSNPAAGVSTSTSEFIYTIGGGASSGSTPPNRNFNVPVISDQLWEEVVPRSGESWRQRIVKRSHQMKVAARAQRRQRKQIGTPGTTQNGDKSNLASNVTSAKEDESGWYLFGSDDEAVVPSSTIRNGDGQDEGEEELSSSDSEVEQAVASGRGAAGAGLAGTAVTMQQVDEDDDDDDDDRPLGAPIWSNANRSAAASNPTNPNPNPNPASDPKSGATSDPTAGKKEDTVQLIFQGLRPESESGMREPDGWTGIERGRRIAFQYVQMLRAEGII